MLALYKTWTWTVTSPEETELKRSRNVMKNGEYDVQYDDVIINMLQAWPPTFDVTSY